MVKWGAKELYDEYEFYRMSDEQIGLVPSGLMLMNERVTLRQEFESLLLFFSNEFLFDFLLKYEITLDDPSRNTAPVITFPKDEYLLNFQRSMKLLEHDFKKRAFRVAKMEELLLYLLEKYPDRTRGFIAEVPIPEFRTGRLHTSGLPGRRISDSDRFGPAFPAERLDFLI